MYLSNAELRLRKTLNNSPFTAASWQSKQDIVDKHFITMPSPELMQLFYNIKSYRKEGSSQHLNGIECMRDLKT